MDDTQTAHTSRLLDIRSPAFRQATCRAMNDPRQLDRLADHELHLGHHAAAERLAWRAAELRGAGA